MPAKAKPKITRKALRRLVREMGTYGVTQIRVATTAGVSPSHVCNVLAGRDKSRSRVIAVAEALVSEARSFVEALDSEKRGA